jgi:hypothetical protein
MANVQVDNITITGPVEDIDAIINAFSTELPLENDPKNILLLDGAKIFPYPSEIKTEGDMEKWRREKWGCIAPSGGDHFKRVSPTHVKGTLHTRWTMPASLYFEVSRRYPRCAIEIDWWCESGHLGSAMLLNGVIVRKKEGLQDDDREVIWDENPS